MLPRIAAALVAIATYMLVARIYRTVGHRRFARILAASIAGTFFVTFVTCSIVWQPAVSPAAMEPAAMEPAAVESYVDVGAFCRNARTSIDGAGIGAIDFVRSGGIGVRDDAAISWAKRLVVAGWATDRAGAAPAVAVCPIVDGKLSARGHAIYGTSRPDLPTRTRLSGFSIGFFSGDVPRGRHAIGVAVLSRDGSWQRVGSVMNLTFT